MRQIGINSLYSKVSLVKEQLVLFVSQIESLENEYLTLVNELEGSFIESKDFWERTTEERKNTANQNAKTMFERLGEIENGLNLIDVQLSQIDSSYAKRHEALSMIVAPNITCQTSGDCLSRMEEIAQEAKQIASECSLTVKVQPLQEITMLFSKKRKKLYERLSELIVEGRLIREKANTIIQRNLKDEISNLDDRKEKEIDNAANETADLLASLEQRHKEELSSTILFYESKIESIMPRATVENLRELSNSLKEQELLPQFFSELISVGTYGTHLGEIAYNPYVVSFVNRLYFGFIENQNLSLPAVLDLRDKSNFIFFAESESLFVRNAICSLIFSFIRHQPASHQKFVLFDPEGRSSGFSPYLEFFRNNQNVMYRVANTCASRLADIISLYRVCGIHFVLATQTLGRLRNDRFSISLSTLNEMYVRLGLKCSEPECNLLFGDTNAKEAFSKMGDVKGTAVYNENFVMEKPIGFKVAFCDTNTQSKMLEAIEQKYGMYELQKKTKIFVGATVPKLSECSLYLNFDALEALSNVPIYLGEPIRIDEPVTLNVSRLKRSTLLVVGSDHCMCDQIIAVYIKNAIKSHPHKLAASTESSIYLFDGLTMMGEPFAEKVGNVVNQNSLDIKIAKDIYDVIPLIDELYSIYEKRKQQKRISSKSKQQFATIHIIINDFQWIEPIGLILNNRSVDEFISDSRNVEPTPLNNENELFSYLNSTHKNDLCEVMDNFIVDLTSSDNLNTSNVSYHRKLMTLIELGYTCGINVVMSCPDFISIKDIIYECIPKFQNKILFALSDKDADRIVSEAQLQELKSNIALYYDGVNPAYQFKPYDIF